MNGINNLKYRRQYLLTAKPCAQLEHWQSEQINSHFLYVHPDCELIRVTKSNTDLFLIGYAIDPNFKEKSSKDILEDISEFNSIDEIPEKLHPLGGRFVLLIQTDSRFIVFNDAFGLRSVFYTKVENNFYISSQPAMLQLVTKIDKSKEHDEYYSSNYVKSTKEHWYPGGISLYEGVYQLIPNHYLDSAKFKQIRFYPNKPLQRMDVEEATKKFASFLEKIMLAANNRLKLALALTSGIDSRTILSCCREVIDDLFVYTLQYRDLSEESNDIRVPMNLSEKLGFKHHLINCRQDLNEDFKEIYVNNTSVSHLNDWGTIAYGIYSGFPQDRVAVKGSGAEIGRCYYYQTGKHHKITSSEYFVNLIRGWKELKFIKNQLSKWYKEIEDYEEKYGFDLTDLFQWEHQGGGWQAQSQHEWDIAQEVFTPYNNRELIEIMLAVHPKYRSYPNYDLFKRVIETNWNQALVEPVNPKSTLSDIKKRIKNVLFYHGIKPKEWLNIF